MISMQSSYGILGLKFLFVFHWKHLPRGPPEKHVFDYTLFYYVVLLQLWQEFLRGFFIYMEFFVGIYVGCSFLVKLQT